MQTLININTNVIYSNIMDYYRSYEYQKFYAKKHYEKNRENILEHKRQKYKCACGSVVNLGDLAKHKRTQKHQLFEIKKHQNYLSRCMYVSACNIDEPIL